MEVIMDKIDYTIRATYHLNKRRMNKENNIFKMYHINTEINCCCMQPVSVLCVIQF